MNITIPKQFQLIISILLGVFILFYGFWSMKDMVFGARLSISGIPEERETESSVLNLSGISHKAKKITINGREVSVDLEGRFSEVVALLPGYNITTIESEDKFGKIETKVFRSYYEPAPPSFAQKEMSNPN
jgi:hypothetical protein